jgi:DNA-binding NtrC family response regulator
MNQENFIGTAWQEVCPFTAEQKRRLQEMFDADVSARERLSAQLHLPDGTESWAEVEVRDDPRDPAGKIFFLYDVTEVHRLRSRLNTVSQTQMVGKSPDMQKMFGIFDKIAPGDWTVLIEGETGVGKELVAQGLHAASPRREGPFIAVNCAGLTDSLLTSQLFGHRRGAFTGAVRDQEGLFEAATGGTLFLDEIGEVPMGVQAALLRVLQEKELTRVGETMPRKVDVRILAATNRDLAKDVADGRFRKDLLYRLQVARLRVPELRHRREDIPLLVATFLAEARRLKDGRVKGVHPDAMRLLVDHAWPGNVRELKNAIDRAIIHCDSQVIEVDDLPREVQGSAPGRLEPEEPEDWRSRLMAALAQAEGNRSRAARLLGISRATLYRRLAEAGIEAKQPRGPEAAERASAATTPRNRHPSAGRSLRQFPSH